MSWLARLFGRGYRKVEDVRALKAGERVELFGRADPAEPLEEPLEHRPCLAVEYLAWPPATTVGMDGAAAWSQAFQVVSHQATDFVLVVDGEQVLVSVHRGEDVTAKHEELLTRYGVGLRAETNIIELGARVGVAGTVQSALTDAGSPHRAEPSIAVVRADRFWVVEEPA